LERIVISIDPFTGRNPSYCFVELKDKDQAEQAMQKLNEQEFFRCPLKVKPCIPKTILPAAVRPFDRWERNDADEHWAGLATAGRRLYVRGLPRPIMKEESQIVVAGF
jgi:hypothetical protein